MMTSHENGEMLRIAELRVGSDSDFPKLQTLIQHAQQDGVVILKRILSAHRTPEAMAKAAQLFPEVSFQDTIVDPSKVQVVLCFAAAGGSAHIAGMTSAETNTPVIALPVEDSSTGHIAALYSMINMPPGVPNGFVLNQETAATLGKRIMQLTANDVEKVYVPEHMMQENLQKLIEQFAIPVTHTIGEATL